MNQSWYRKILKTLFIAFSLSLFLGISNRSYADVIQLKSGQQVEAPIVTRTDEYIKIDTGVGVVITYYLDEIANIKSSGLKNQLAPMADQNDVEFEMYQKFLRNQLELLNHQKRNTRQFLVAPISNPPADPVNKQIEDIETTVDNLNKDLSGEIEKLTNNIKETILLQCHRIQRSINVIKRLAGIEAITRNVLPSRIALLVIVSWFIACYPTMLLARKFREKFYWMAWLPVFQIYLLVKLAQKPLWWFLNLFVPLFIIVVPFLFPVQHYMGWFFIGVFMAVANFLMIPMLLWRSIIRFMGHPGWWGIWTMIPVANVFIIHKLNQLLFQPKEQHSHRFASHPQIGSTN